MFQKILAGLKRIARRPPRTPTTLQMEAVECGAAALAIILAYYKSYVSLEELRVSCGVSRDGSKASNILTAARQYGFTAKGYRRDPKRVRLLPMPAIVHWNFNHFVVLEGFRNGKVYLNDPASGPKVVTETEFDEAFTGVVLTFTPNNDYTPTGRKPSLAKLLAKRLQNSKAALAFVFLVSLMLIIPGFLIPAVSRIFVDYYLIQGQTTWLMPLLIGMGLTALLRSVLSWLQQHYLLRLEMKLSLTNSAQLFWHILRLPMTFFIQRSAGDISARIGQNDRVAQLLSGQLATTLLNLVILIFYAILMLAYSPPLTVIGFAMAFLNFVALRAVSRKRIDANMRMVESQGKLMSATFGSLQQIETIKSTGAENDAFSKWGGYQAKVINALQELGATTQILSVVPIFLNQLATILLLIVGGFLVIRGDMTIGMLVAFQSLMASFLAPVGQLVNLGSQIQEVEGIVNRLNDVLNYEPDPQAEMLPQAEQAQTLNKLKGRLEIRNLTFGYNLLSPPLIEDFNLTIEPGTRVALVGGSGSGKSTIARVVAGLYAPWRGNILFDDQPRAAYPRIVLNNSVRLVDQDIFLFEGTIQDNITMWDDNISEANIIRATRDAQIEDVITDRQDAYQSIVEETGRNFSGGQRQRLEIARALVTNPTILILDEATSALDPVTEKLIDQQLRQRGCTCLVVAHRLSAIRDCDEIIVLEKGQVVERGTHEQLWRMGGQYTRLIQQETPESELVLDNIWEALYA